LGIFGKNSKKQAQIAAEFADLDKESAQENDSRLTHIGAWAAGTELALTKATNQEPAIVVAEETNKRIEALANKPEYTELQAVYSIVNTYLTNQVQGAKMMAKKDAIIIDLYKQIEETNKDKEEEVTKAREQATKTAQAADSYQQTLSKMNKFFGLGAIFYGIKRFITSAAIAIGIFGVLFIVLRIFAATNPIAGAVFSIFNIGFSWIINIIKSLAPKAAHVAGLIEQSVMQDYKTVLTKVIDAVEIVQDRAKAANSEAKVSDVLTEVSKSKMTPEQEGIIGTIKQSLNWR